MVLHPLLSIFVAICVLYVLISYFYFRYYLDFFPWEYTKPKYKIEKIWDGVLKNSGPFSRIYLFVKFIWVNHLLSVPKLLFRFPILTMATGSVGISLAVLYYTSIKAVVGVTLLYASIIFFSQFLIRPHPFLQISYKRSEPGDDDEESLRFRIIVINDGDKDISNLNISYKIYDKSGNPLTSWTRTTPEDARILAPVRLKSGKQTKDISIRLFQLNDAERKESERTDKEFAVFENPSDIFPLYIHFRAGQKGKYSFLGVNTINRLRYRYSDSP